MKFMQAGNWKREANLAHGFGMRCPGEEKPVRKDWLGKPVEAEGETFPLFSLRQVHGDRVFLISDNNPQREEIWQEEGDCLITRKEGIALGVFTADCLPILLYDPERRTIAVVHSGWRGTARGILRKAVERMTSEFRCDSSRIQAALGPCIGPCCYEVDRPVKQSLEEGGFSWGSISYPRGEGKWSLDLPRANSLLLEASGVRRENMEILKLCTSCRRDLFYSYRKGDRTRGRQLNFIALTENPAVQGRIR
jgi:polyphenol oxidase